MRSSLLLVIALLAAACGSTVVEVGDQPGSSAGVSAALDCTDDQEVIIAAMRSGRPDVDYQPAASLAELLGRTAAVFGGINSVSRQTFDDETWTVFGGFGGGFEVIAGEAGDAGFVETFSTSSSWASQYQVDPLDPPISIEGLGVGVIAFIEPSPAAPGGHVVDIQGLFIACDDEPYVAVFDSAPADTPPGSLTELMDAIDATLTDPDPPPSVPEMRIEPETLTAGGEFSVSYDGYFSRGGYYLLSRIDSDGDVAAPEYLLESHHNPGTPQVYPIAGDGWGVDDYGVDIAAPDRLVLPDDIDAGRWQLCTANAIQEACADLQIG